MEAAEHEGHTQKLESFVDFGINERYAFSVHLSYGGLEIQEWNAEYKQCDEVGYEKYTASVFVDKVGESPEGSKAYWESNDGEKIFRVAVVNMGVFIVVGNGGGFLMPEHGLSLFEFEMFHQNDKI